MIELPLTDPSKPEIKNETDTEQNEDYLDGCIYLNRIKIEKRLLTYFSSILFQFIVRNRFF